MRKQSSNTNSFFLGEDLSTSDDYSNVSDDDNANISGDSVLEDTMGQNNILARENIAESTTAKLASNLESITTLSTETPIVTSIPFLIACIWWFIFQWDFTSQYFEKSLLIYHLFDFVQMFVLNFNIIQPFAMYSVVLWVCHIWTSLPELSQEYNDIYLYSVQSLKFSFRIGPFLTFKT